MSRGIVVTKEELPELRQWNPPSIDEDLFIPPPHPSFTAGISAVSASPSPAPAARHSSANSTSEGASHESTHALPTVKEIEAISKDAYDEGFERGQQEGKTQGIEQGHAEGLAKGLEEGVKQGQEQGHAEGLTKGLEEGVKQGQEQGHQEGFAKGLEEGLKKGQEQGHQEGFAKGLEEGKQEGREQGHQEGLGHVDEVVRNQRERLRQIVAFLEQPLVNLDAEVEDQLVTLSIALAKQVIRSELRLNPSEIVLVVREALESLPTARRHLRIVLHPEDVLLVQEALGEGERNVRLLGDSALTRGGCRVETDTSRIDVTVEQRLNQVIAQLLP
ncbi:flagellar assembly protein FliH [Gammaproteobacteria bacterium]